MSSRVHEKDPSPFPRVRKRQRPKEREGIKSIVLAISKSRFFFRFLRLLENRFPSDARDIIIFTFDQTVHNPPTIGSTPCTHSAQSVAEWISFYSSSVFLLPLYLTPFRLEIANDPVFNRTLTEKKAHRDTNRNRNRNRKENEWVNKQQQLCVCAATCSPYTRYVSLRTEHKENEEEEGERRRRRKKKEANGQERTFDCTVHKHTKM